MISEICTERLIIRPFQVDDASALNEIANQEYVLKWMPDWESTIEDTKKLIQFFINQYPKASMFTARVMFAVELDGHIVGMVGIGNKEEVDNEIEIAYFISEKYAGHGYASEATKAVVLWTFDNLKIDHLIAIIEPDNYPSKRIVKKCGFIQIGTRMVLNSGETKEKLYLYYRLNNTHNKLQS